MSEKYSLRKTELRAILEQAAVARRNALSVLLVANRLTRHLTAGQRRAAGIDYSLSDIQARIAEAQPIPAAAVQNSGEQVEDDPDYAALVPAPADNVSLPELKRRELATLMLIDNVKQKLLQLDILELRCRELMLSINKAMEAFTYESAVIHRKIYPFGIFSRLHRKLHLLFGGAYFALRDLQEIAALGAITGCILKIADSRI
ncbi:MAG: hypothetical protein FWD91_05315 [Treponema sp.]|nr:hypothetical protein [Treponema sp.]